MFCSVLLPPAHTGTLYRNHTRSWPPQRTHLPWSLLHTCILTQAGGSGFPTGPDWVRCSDPRTRPVWVSSSGLVDTERPARRFKSFGTIASPLGPLTPPDKARTLPEAVPTRDEWGFGGCRALCGRESKYTTCRGQVKIQGHILPT